MKLVIENIELKPKYPEQELWKSVGDKLGIDFNFDFRILRRSLDARRKDRIVYRYRILVDLPDETAERIISHRDVSVYKAEKTSLRVYRLHGLKVLIVGLGPAGAFCALRLIESGADVEIIERGKPVEERLEDINILRKSGKLNCESNVLFGEGGAGTYSDGKLNTGINRKEVEWFFRMMVELGAPEDILYDARPHVGTDRLIKIVSGIRERILNSGSRIYFNERVADIYKKFNCINGIITSSGREFRANVVILAVGHSARDTYEMLERRGIEMAKKGFAIGVRVEHPAELINFIQYGTLTKDGVLPPAEYRLAFNNRQSGRGVYSFCMCPGGEVINSSSEEAGLCMNGMSNFHRNFPFSNAAIVVTVREDDIVGGPLSGLEFQRRVEERAYQEGGGGFIAPVQTIKSFLNDNLDSIVPENSYMPGIRPSSIRSFLPEWIADEIKTALYQFDKRMKGFITEKGLLIGAETRTSSPVRISRNDNFESVSLKGLFPVGEGSGYAGGIVSSAVDGIRAADRIAEMYSNDEIY